MGVVLRNGIMRDQDIIARIGQWITNAERNLANAKATGNKLSAVHFEGQITAYKDVIGLIS